MKILKEPLLHFLAIGAAFFVLYAWLNPGDLGSGQRIVVDEGRVRSLSESFERTWNRAPTGDELARLIEEFALEEIYYRQALEMGLDENDAVIRRRLRQKLEFLSTSMATVTQPEESELQSFLDQYREQYRRPDRYSFEQIYVNPARSAAELEQRLAELESALANGLDVQGDDTLIAKTFDNASSYQVDNVLGRGFAQQLDELELEEWSPPLRSGLGFHFVKVHAREVGEVPALDEIRAAVLRDWSYEKETETRREIERELLAKYEIVVHLPREDSAP